MRVPWYETPAPTAEVTAVEEPTTPPEVFLKSGVRIPEPLLDIAGPSPLNEAPSATIELPHIDLTQPLAVTEPPTASVDQPALADVTAPCRSATCAGERIADQHRVHAGCPDRGASGRERYDRSRAAHLGVPRFAPHVAAAWSGGICLLVLVSLVGYVRFISRLPAGHEVDAEWIDQWQALLADHGIERAVPLRVTADMGPMLCRLPRDTSCSCQGRCGKN